MHELSLAYSIGEIAMAALRDNTGFQPPEPTLTVGGVWVRVGDLSGVDPEALQFCFEVVRGEWVETAGAVLRIERAPARVRCAGCGWTSELSLGEAGCPSCGALGHELISGRELEVFRVELHPAESEPPAEKPGSPSGEPREVAA